MIFFISLLILFFVLILFVLTCTIIKAVLLLTTKYKYENKYLIIPSLLTILIFVLMFFAWYITLSKILKVDLITLYFDILIKSNNVNVSKSTFIGVTIVYCILGIVLQSFSYFTVNMNYLKVSGFFRGIFKKHMKISNKDINDENFLKVDERPNNLTYLNSLVSSLFTFSSMFFFVFILLAIGNVLSSKIT